jgi:hypothetical protein
MSHFYARWCNTSSPPKDRTAVSTIPTTLDVPGDHRVCEITGDAFGCSTIDVGHDNGRTVTCHQRAVASSTPLPAPVTIATLPSSRPIYRA